MRNLEVLVPLLHLLLDVLQPAAKPLEHVLRSLLTEHPAGRRGQVDLSTTNTIEY